MALCCATHTFDAQFMHCIPGSYKHLPETLL